MTKGIDISLLPMDLRNKLLKMYFCIRTNHIALCPLNPLPLHLQNNDRVNWYQK